MAVDVDFRESLRGLWVSQGVGAYLAHFFPRLKASQPHLIPVRSGINVLYGRNGAGKTQMLGALAAASNWEMGPMDGFLLEDPTWSLYEEGQSVERRASDLSHLDLLDAVSNEDSTSVDLDWTWGYHRDFIEKVRWPEALELVDEFLQARTFLLTRALRPDSLSDGWLLGPRQRLLPPSATELVPVLLPNAEAPRVRAHLADMRESLRRTHAEVMESLGYVRDEHYGEWEFSDAEGLDYRDGDRQDEVNSALDVAIGRWRQDWAWSPLLNARNVGKLTSGLDEHPKIYGDLAIHSRNAAAFLPPMLCEEEREYGDFDSRSAPPIFRPFQEDSSAANLNGPVDEISYTAGRTGDVSEEEWRQRAQEYFESTVDNLKRRLAFLPGFSSALHAVGGYGSDSEAVLMIANNARASAGSRAEVRWLQFATAQMGEWLFFDEPEAGLHRTAEADLATTLASPAWAIKTRTHKGVTRETPRTLVIATHSPEFLGLSDANILHVDEGQAKELTSVARHNLALLGLRPADLLSRVKIFLLVEGEHERIVFETLLGDELHRLRVGMVVARGGKNMKDVFDSQVLFDFSEARIVALLDNIDAHRVHDLWGRARDLAAIGQVDQAGALVRAELPRKGSGENRFLGNFLTRALEDGEHERVGAWGLSREDIVLYLPPSAFGIKRPWEDVLSQYDPDSDGSLKPWLSKKYGADFSLANVRAAAESLDHIPDDFTALVTALAFRP